MATPGALTTTAGAIRTLADLIERLGGIAPDRIWFHPAPGTAAEDDVLVAERRENRLCELVEGTLVEKSMGYRESLLAVALAGFLREFVAPRNLGLITGADGFVRLFPGLVRIPDVAFASWDRLPGRRVPTEPMPDVAPDLAVEILSAGNTSREMARKIEEYFAAGVRCAWLIDPAARTVAVHTPGGPARVLGERDVLDGSEVLPGFSLPLDRLFAELDRTGSPPGD
jgi:Uma2 family endonuclease